MINTSGQPGMINTLNPLGSQSPGIKPGHGIGNRNSTIAAEPGSKSLSNASGAQSMNFN